jgi:hypothetical protein
VRTRSNDAGFFFVEYSPRWLCRSNLYTYRITIAFKSTLIFALRYTMTCLRVFWFLFRYGVNCFAEVSLFLLRLIVLLWNSSVKYFEHTIILLKPFFDVPCKKLLLFAYTKICTYYFCGRHRFYYYLYSRDCSELITFRAVVNTFSFP